MDFWENVDNELAYLGMSRKELALKAGIPVSSIAKGIVRGSIPAADTALRIAKILNVSLETLLPGFESAEERKSKQEQATQLFLYKKYSSLIKSIESLPHESQRQVRDVLEMLVILMKK